VVALAVDNLSGGPVTVIDVADAFLRTDGSLYLFSPGGRLTYFDRYHLSDAGVRLVYARLDAAMSAALIDVRARSIRTAPVGHAIGSG
jgi:hypothetical protein